MRHWIVTLRGGIKVVVSGSEAVVRELSKRYGFTFQAETVLPAGEFENQLRDPRNADLSWRGWEALPRVTETFLSDPSGQPIAFESGIDPAARDPRAITHIHTHAEG